MSASSGVDMDVVVIGSGLAGMAAAITAHEAGCRRVLIAESEPEVGGSSRLSGGILLGPGSRYQRAAGVEDSATTFLHDYMALNRWSLEVSVVRRYAEEVGPSVDWLGDLGVEFHPDLVYSGDEPVPRGLCAVDRGQGIVDALHRQCRQRDIDIARGRRVDRLVQDGTGVCGIAVGEDEMSAAAVVVATGGFAANPAKLVEHYPSAAATEWAWYTGIDGARGDGIDLGRSVGADLAGHDRGLRLLHPNFHRMREAIVPSWLVLVDRQGRRFADETAPYGIMDSLVRARGDVAFAVFDDLVVHPDAAAEASYRQAPTPGRARRRSANWNPDTVMEMVASGRIKVADTVGDLARALRIPANRLEGTIDRYNAGATSGHDDFGKGQAFIRPLQRPPFYGAEVRPATVALTACGLRIDRDARVLDVAGRAVPGLFAAGEAAGGVLGDVYVGGGNSLSTCATIGRIAGRSAAARALTAS